MNCINPNCNWGWFCGCWWQKRHTCQFDESTNRTAYKYLTTLQLVWDSEATIKMLELLKWNPRIKASEIMKEFWVEVNEPEELQQEKSKACVFNIWTAWDKCVNCWKPKRHFDKYPTDCSALI